MLDIGTILLLTPSAATASTYVICTPEKCPSEYVPTGLAEAPLVLAIEVLETTRAQDLEVSTAHVESHTRLLGYPSSNSALYTSFRVTEVIRGDGTISEGSLVMMQIQSDRTAREPTIGETGILFGRKAPWAPILEGIPLIQRAHPLEWGYISKAAGEDDSGMECSIATNPYDPDMKVVSASLGSARKEELSGLGATSVEQLPTGSLTTWTDLDSSREGSPCTAASWTALDEEVRSW